MAEKPKTPTVNIPETRGYSKETTHDTQAPPPPRPPAPQSK